MIDPATVPVVPDPASLDWVLHGVRLSMRVIGAQRSARGGDWCEAFPVADDVVALSIGDVSGHGAAKYDAMLAMREAIRSAAARGRDPAQTLIEAHRFLRRYDPELYATALFALLNTRARTLVFANAGHPPPLLAAPARTAFLEYPDSDLPLGVDDALPPVLRTVRVPAGALLVLYTDGVTERDRKPLQGAAELCDAAQFAAQYSTLPTAAVIERQMFLTGANRDDAAILTAWMLRRHRR